MDLLWSLIDLKILEYLSKWLKYLYLQFICMFHSLSFFRSKARQRLIWKLNDTIHVSDQITLIPNHISYLSTWTRLCSLFRFRGVMRFLKELVYTGEEKETLDNHTRKMVLRDLQVAPIKTFFFLLRWKGERREIMREKSLIF